MKLEQWPGWLRKYATEMENKIHSYSLQTKEIGGHEIAFLSDESLHKSLASNAKHTGHLIKALTILVIINIFAIGWTVYNQNGALVPAVSQTQSQGAQSKEKYAEQQPIPQVQERIVYRDRIVNKPIILMKKDDVIRYTVNGQSQEHESTYAGVLSDFAEFKGKPEIEKLKIRLIAVNGISVNADLTAKKLLEGEYALENITSYLK